MKEMSEINYNAFLFLAAKFDIIHQYCFEHLKHLGIPGFSYIRIYKDGGFFGINNKLEYCSYYAQHAKRNRYYIADHPIAIPENKLVSSTWPLFPSNEIHKSYHSRNLWHGIDLCRQNDDILEAWTFMGSLNDKDIMASYVKNTALLHEFISFFEPALSAIIGPWDAVPFGKYLLPPLFHPMIKANKQPDLKGFITFLRTHRHLYSSKGYIRISNREFQCLHLLATGCPFKEIARKLSISPRTVEGYIKSLKLKLGSYRKENLIKCYLEHLDWYGLDINSVVL